MALRAGACFRIQVARLRTDSGPPRVEVREGFLAEVVLGEALVG